MTTIIFTIMKKKYYSVIVHEHIKNITYINHNNKNINGKNSYNKINI